MLSRPSTTYNKMLPYKIIELINYFKILSHCVKYMVYFNYIANFCHCDALESMLCWCIHLCDLTVYTDLTQFIWSHFWSLSFNKLSFWTVEEVLRSETYRLFFIVCLSHWFRLIWFLMSHLKRLFLHCTALLVFTGRVCRTSLVWDLHRHFLTDGIFPSRSVRWAFSPGLKDTYIYRCAWKVLSWGQCPDFPALQRPDVFRDRWQLADK